MFAYVGFFLYLCAVNDANKQNIYSDVERDPRGRVITAAYAAMTTMPEATAADDAAAAKWWPLNDLPPLAFDHETILRDAKRVMNIKD